MIVANMATYPPRRESLIYSIESLIFQVDILNLCLNGYKEIPAELAAYGRVNPIIPDEDFMDVGKFLPDTDEDDYILLTDDDIVYPPDYLDTMFVEYSHYDDIGAVIGVHGVIYPDIYDGNPLHRRVFGFWEALDSARVVNQLGTGTVFAKGGRIPTLGDMIGSRRYADVRFARICREKGIPLVAIRRRAGWLREIDGRAESIYDGFTKKWDMDVRREVQDIAGYSKLDIDAVLKVECE
jgi:hypothetical protein